MTFQQSQHLAKEFQEKTNKMYYLQKKFIEITSVGKSKSKKIVIRDFKFVNLSRVDHGNDTWPVQPLAGREQTRMLALLHAHSSSSST